MSLNSKRHRLAKGCLCGCGIIFLVTILMFCIVSCHDQQVKPRDIAILSVSKQLSPAIRSNLVVEAAKLLAMRPNQTWRCDEKNLCPVMYSLGHGNIDVCSCEGRSWIVFIVYTKVGWVHSRRVLVVVQPDGVLPQEYNYDVRFDESGKIGLAVDN